MNKLIWMFLLTFTLVLKAFSIEEVLIDFNNLTDTTIDFSDMANRIAFSDEQRKVMIFNLKPELWEVRTNQSSWLKEARERSFVIPVTNSLNYPGITLLGIRAFFPQRNANSYIEVKPPYEIPSYYDDPKNPDGMGTMFIHKGVVRNVGILRKMNVRFLGNNFKYSLYVRIKNRKDEIKDIFIGYLDFVGWRTKTWVNGNYDNELKVREAYKHSIPYYPDEYPFVKFVSFIIHRDQDQITGNFVTMVKEISIDFDEAFLEVGNAEYKQEDIFFIQQFELIDRAKTEMRNVHKKIYLAWVEKQKQDPDTTSYRYRTTQKRLKMLQKQQQASPTPIK